MPGRKGSLPSQNEDVYISSYDGTRVTVVVLLTGPAGTIQRSVKTVCEVILAMPLSDKPLREKPAGFDVTAQEFAFTFVADHVIVLELPL